MIEVGTTHGNRYWNVSSVLGGYSDHIENDKKVDGESEKGRPD